MALQCQVSLSYASYTAGQTPPPMATVFVYNPNAATVTVTGAKLYAFAVNDPVGREIPFAPAVLPTGPGMTVTVPALGSINIGPLPVVMGSAANANAFQMVNQVGNLNPTNPQIALPPQTNINVGCLVYGSDGSINRAGTAGLLVSYTSSPPLGYQGGFLNFAAPNNFIMFRFLGAL